MRFEADETHRLCNLFRDRRRTKFHPVAVLKSLAAAAWRASPKTPQRSFAPASAGLADTDNSGLPVESDPLSIGNSTWQRAL